MGAALLLNIAAIVPFLAGHSLHGHFDSAGKPLILFAMFLLVAFPLSVVMPSLKTYSRGWLWIVGLLLLVFGTGAYRYRRGDYEYNRTLQHEHHPWAIVVGISVVILAYATKDRNRDRQ